MHFKKTYRLGREESLILNSMLTNQVLTIIYKHFLKARNIGLSLLLLPAIITGCSSSGFPDDSPSHEFSSHTILKCNAPLGVENGSTLDILVFNDDRLQRLDSYQRVEDFDGQFSYRASTEGEKIFFLCCNPQTDRYGWAGINSYSGLERTICDLEKEQRENLVMTGEFRGEAGGTSGSAYLTPLVSEIFIESLKCDFSGTTYPGRKMTEVKAYLTYVNAACGLLESSGTKHTRIINSGMFNEYEAGIFGDISMITQDLAEELGASPVNSPASMFCYPHHDKSGRNTRLVIEGDIDGETYYWPIEIGDGEGIERNCRHAFRIFIKRKGTSDPDILIEPTDIELEIKVKSWLEKRDWQISF